MDNYIARFMLLASKLEFFLVNSNLRFAHIEGEHRLITGVNWERVGQALEEQNPFDEFDFTGSGFQVFKETIPQRLVVSSEGALKWDSDEVKISSWHDLLRRSYAQLRNNVAHGNKA